MVDSLKSEFGGKILFLIADYSSPEGKLFARGHNVANITLIFFRPNGEKITTLSGVHSEEFLRRAFKEVFEL